MTELSDSTNLENLNNDNTNKELDQTTLNQIVNGLQLASLSGATSLPSRDIPMMTDNLVTDEQVNPNYVPAPAIKDYITDPRTDMNYYINAEKNNASTDSLFEELQTPILLAILYFMFQLPAFKHAIFKYLSFLCKNDGNYTLNGLIFVCLLFGFVYYFITKVVKQLSRF